MNFIIGAELSWLSEREFNLHSLPPSRGLKIRSRSSVSFSSLCLCECVWVWTDTEIFQNLYSLTQHPSCRLLVSQCILFFSKNIDVYIFRLLNHIDSHYIILSKNLPLKQLHYDLIMSTYKRAVKLREIRPTIILFIYLFISNNIFASYVVYNIESLMLYLEKSINVNWNALYYLWCP